MVERCASFLACPVCGRPMGMGERAVACPDGHHFDIARSGYVNLVSGRGARRTGDTPEMVAARAAFIEAGHLRPLTESLVAAAAAEGPLSLIAEIGSGTGHNLEWARRGLAGDEDAAPCAIGLDASKPAAARAAGTHPECVFVVADAEEGVPLVAGCADLVLSVFAPRPAAHLARVTRPGGMLLVAAAAEGHLEALRRRFDLLAIRPNKLKELRARLAPAFEPVSSELVDYPLALSPDDCIAAVMMGPNAWHRAGPPDRPVSPISDRASVLVAAFRRTAARGT